MGELLDNFPGAGICTHGDVSGISKSSGILILRKTVARVATLQQVAVVGGLNVDVIVNRLRKEAGLGEGDSARRNWNMNILLILRPTGSITSRVYSKVRRFSHY